MGASDPITNDEFDAFLLELSKYGNVTQAAKAISRSRYALYQHYDRNPVFAKSWDDAQRIGNKALEDEARRRAYEGWEEGVYYQGACVDTVIKYSDSLLTTLLRAHDPKFAQAMALSGPGGGPIDIRDTKELTRDELIKIASVALPVLSESAELGKEVGDAPAGGEGAVS
jgi:hypothetical protein